MDRHGTLRHPSFKGLRNDKSPREVVREMPVDRRRGMIDRIWWGMPRHIWSGTVSLGLVNVPVKLYNTVKAKTIRFHQLRQSDGCRIRLKNCLRLRRGGGARRGDRQGATRSPRGATW